MCRCGGLRQPDAHWKPTTATAAAQALALGVPLLLAWVSGCAGADPSIGLEADFRASGGQYVTGDLALARPGEATGPEVHTINSNNSRLYPGVQNKAISGTVDEHGATVAIGLAGDKGYWIVPVAGEDQMSPPDLAFSTRGSFAPTLLAGSHTLIFRAVAPDGTVGPPKTQTLTLASAPADGAFVISLEWDGPADLDLHVMAPATGGPGMTEIWTKKRNSLGTRSVAEGPFPAETIAAAGTLDFDSNSSCVNDGRDNENVIWTQSPPAGHYTARVDAASLCGAAATRWRLTVAVHGSLVAEVFGELGDSATAPAHVAGAGLTVWENDVL